MTEQRDDDVLPHDALDPVFHLADIEVKQEAETARRQLQISEQLGFVNWQEPINGFQLDNDPSAHKHVEAKPRIERHTIVSDRNDDLPRFSDSLTIEFDSHTLLVNRL